MTIIKSTAPGSFTSIYENIVNRQLGIPAFGRALDGNLTLSAAHNINTERLGTGLSRTVDAPVASVTAIDGTGKVLSVLAQGGVIADFLDGDVAVIVNLQGDPSHHGNVGSFEFVKINGNSTGTTIHLVNPLENVYGDVDNTSIGSQKVIIMRLPEYGAVTLSTSSGILSASPFNGTWGGILGFFASSIATSGGAKVSADGLGYRGSTVLGGTGEGEQGGLNTVQTSGVGSGGGGGFDGGSSGAVTGGNGNSPGTLLAGGGGGGGSGGGSGGGGGYAAPGGNGSPGSAGGGGGGGGGNKGGGYTPAAPGTDASADVAGTGGGGITGGTPPGTAGGDGGAGDGSNPGAAGGGATNGSAALPKVFLGGGGGSAGSGTNGAPGGDATTSGPNPVSGGAGGSGGGGGGLGAPGGNPAGGGVPYPGLDGTTAGGGAPGGGIAIILAQTIGTARIGADGGSGIDGGVGGDGQLTDNVPGFAGDGYGGSSGGGGGQGGGGGGSGGSLFVFANTVLPGASLTASFGPGGVGGSGGAQGPVVPPGGGNPSSGNGGGGAGSPGNPGADASPGRVKVTYFTNGTTFSSSSPDGAGDFPGSTPPGYKQSL